MFAPFDGVAEDPANGSAACALAGLLAMPGRHAWKIAQGVEMGRDSRLDASPNSDVTVAGVGGPSVLVGRGTLNVE
jgi:trans-2,3-dihydro-3-hydroxyanthranilate isomerase